MGPDKRRDKPYYTPEQLARQREIDRRVLQGLPLQDGTNPFEGLRTFGPSRYSAGQIQEAQRQYVRDCTDYAQQWFSNFDQEYQREGYPQAKAQTYVDAWLSSWNLFWSRLANDRDFLGVYVGSNRQEVLEKHKQAHQQQFDIQWTRLGRWRPD